MKTFALALSVALLLPVAAQARCVGTSSFQTCTDDSGNQYTVQRYGNTTNVQGFNANTGSTWSQSSSTFGNTTHHNGIASDGNAWSGTTNRYGNTINHNGIDSKGNFYNKTCNQFGCF